MPLLMAAADATVESSAENRTRAEKFLLGRFPACAIKVDDIDALHAMLDMAVEQGMAMSAWDSEEPTARTSQLAVRP